MIHIKLLRLTSVPFISTISPQNPHHALQEHTQTRAGSTVFPARQDTGVNNSRPLTALLMVSEQCSASCYLVLKVSKQKDTSNIPANLRPQLEMFVFFKASSIAGENAHFSADLGKLTIQVIKHFRANLSYPNTLKCIHSHWYSTNLGICICSSIT